MTISPSSLQTFNNELVKGLESLKDQRTALVKQIATQQKEAHSLEEQIEQLTQKLTQITQDLGTKTALREEYDRLIQDTETTYGKIVESSETLLKVMNTEANHLQNFKPIKK
jgi:Sjoegren syndrome nuclear autoantigen 1